MSFRGLHKIKRELGFDLMVLNIRRIVAQQTTLFDRNLKNDNSIKIM